MNIFFIISNWRKGLPFLFYLVLISLSVLYVTSWVERVAFFTYSLTIFWILHRILKKRKSPEIFLSDNIQKQTKFFIYLLIFSSLFLFFTRLLPFIRFGEAPLGYDTGFYLNAFKNLTGSIGLEALNGFDFAASPFYFLGIPPLFLFYFLHILSQFLIAGGLYLLFRSLKMPSSFNLSVIAVFLFSTSVIQFLGYWWAFGQQMLAMGLLLITIALFLRQSPLMMLTGYATFFVHTATATPLVFSFLFFFIIYIGQIFFQKKYFNTRLIIILGFWLILSIFVFLVKLDRILEQLDFFLEFGGLLKNVPFWKVAEARGLFISLSHFHLLALFILPLSLFGFIYPSIWIQVCPSRRFFFEFFLILYIMFLVTLALTFSPIIYQARFSIIFSLFLIIFAAPSFLLLVEYFLREKIEKVFLSLFIIIFFIRAGFVVWSQQPVVSNKELQEIKSLAFKTEPRASIMGTHSYYTPWLQGFSDRSVIGPGYVNDSWGLDTWVQFWFGDSDEERLRLLRQTRPSLLYLYVGEKQPLNNTPYWKFIQTSPYFTQVTLHTWRFTP